MPTFNDEQELQCGNIVAVEGNADLVATQLRLLPPSPKILVLPSLSTALPLVSAEPFEARRWVGHVYHAFTSRTERARSFLQYSTSAQPRLVFINGGSVSARVECILRIAEQITNGRIDKAEVIFNEIVKDGVAGVLRPNNDEEDIINPETPLCAQSGQSIKLPADYRGAIAMEAADRLDRQTADLQSTSNSSGIKEYHQNATKYTRGSTDPADSHSEFSDDLIKTTVVIIPDELKKRDIVLELSKPGIFGILPATTYSPEIPGKETVRRQSWDEFDEGLDYLGEDILSTEEKHEVAPGIIEVGQAQVIRVDQITPPRHMRSVKSVDGLIRSAIKARQRSRSLTPKRISNQAVAHRAAALKGLGHGRRASLSDLEKPLETPFVRASKTTIKKSSSKSSCSTQSMLSPKQSVYVDRGTHAGEKLSPKQIERATLSFEPVFAVIEDLVIHFTDGAHNSLFESVVRSYKNGSYPVIPVSETSTRSSQPNSPQSIYGFAEERLRHLSHWTAENHDRGYNRKYEINPYISENNQAESRQSWWPQRKGTRIEYQAVSIPAPLSPAATPPLTQVSIAHRFHRFSTNNSKTATGIQNSLRAVLNVHFPPELTNYRQYSVPLEADRLWKPVFRDSDGHSQEGKTVDLILAIGAEDGVKSSLFNEIAGQVERLGTKRNGTTRSGKLDMRFLIASAMQTFTSQSLSHQSQSSTSPFSSPMLLASLLVPQLEIYLANNVSTRLLIIHYSSSHLPTILALRHHVGADTFKIAGILDSSISSQKNAASNPLRPVGNGLSNANVTALNDRTRFSSRSSGRSSRTHSPNQSIEFKHNSSEPISTSFLRANYVLPATASDVEKATFLSNITDNLIEKSSYYTPEPTLNTPRKISSPLSPLFPPNISGPRKFKNSETTPADNSNRQRAQSREEKDSRVGQFINNNIIRSQSSQGNYATPIKGTFASNGQSFNTSDSTTHGHLTSSSITSISSSTASNPTRPYSRDSASHALFPISNSTTSTIFNSPSNSNSTLNNNNNTQNTPNISQNMHTQLPLPPPLPVNMIPRPSTAEVREHQSEQDWANFYFGESEEEDELDRILMPKVPRRMERRKGNSRKALRFLGLG